MSEQDQKKTPHQLIVKFEKPGVAEAVDAAWQQYQTDWYEREAEKLQNMSGAELAERLRKGTGTPKPNKHDWAVEIFMRGWKDYNNSGLK